MAVPRRLLGIIDLARDLVERRAALAAGPFRVEVEARLLETGIPAAIGDVLPQAAFLAPRGQGTGTPAVTMRSLELAEEHDLWLDLEVPADSAFEGRLRDRMRGRVARLRLVADQIPDLAGGGVLDRASDLAATLLGRVTLVARAAAGDVATLTSLLLRLGALPSPPDLLVIPRDGAALVALRDAWPALGLRADATGLNLRVANVGLAAAGKPLDALAGWNILAESIRALFRPRPTLCPFPWLMRRFESQGAVRPCPQPSGPVIPSGDDSWNGAASQALRNGFLTGSVPAVCRGCTLLPRVLRSLADARPVLKAEPLPARAMDV